jgi:hypothetical protein
MKAILEKGRQFGSWLWSFLGDPKTKNALLVILLLMTFFGIVAPETATSLRDTVVALAF